MALSKFIITDIMPFNIGLIMEGGQAFRWLRGENGEYIGVVGKRVIAAKQDCEQLEVEMYSESDETYDEALCFLINYFDVERDYKSIEKRMAQYKELQPAVTFASGSRILRQDPWETTVSFILSANNSIRNIRNTIERMCREYGNPILFCGKTYYTFPRPEALAFLTERELRTTKCGFRARRIIDTAKMVCEGHIDLHSLQSFPTSVARCELLRLPGVGKKVADCIMLFSMGKYDAFPIDVWIKRCIEYIYFDSQEIPFEKLNEFAEAKFKDMAGFVQQYLFHYARANWENFIQKNLQRV
jgi:N-glycosylase/DNA lyase